jgi:hypothetical protein
MPPTSPAGSSAQLGKTPIAAVLINVCIVAFFIVGAVVAAASFGLFGCACLQVEQYPQQPPAPKPMPEPAWSTSQGNP